jgi:hypothetical protein
MYGNITVSIKIRGTAHSFGILGHQQVYTYKQVEKQKSGLHNKNRYVAKITMDMLLLLFINRKVFNKKLFLEDVSAVFKKKLRSEWGIFLYRGHNIVQSKIR